MVSNTKTIIDAINDSKGKVLVRTESSNGQSVFFPVKKQDAINVLESLDKPFDWCVNAKNQVILG